MCRIDGVFATTWFGTAMRRSRKERQCDECCRTIAKGERYARSAYLNDGDFCVNAACVHCHAARSWLDVHCGGWVTEALREELEDHADEGHREDGLLRLIVGVKRKWQRFDGRGLMKVTEEIVSNPFTVTPVRGPYGITAVD